MQYGVMGFHRANFGLPRPSVLKSCGGTQRTERQTETDGRTDRQLLSFHNAPSLRRSGA